MSHPADKSSYRKYFPPVPARRHPSFTVRHPTFARQPYLRQNRVPITIVLHSTRQKPMATR